MNTKIAVAVGNGHCQPMNHSFLQTISALESSLTCRLIASALEGDSVLPFDSPASAVLEFALSNRFSQVALQDRLSSRPRRVTHVALVDLKEGRIDEVRPLELADLIASTTPIARLIDLLVEESFYFVLDRNEIQAIVTRADLNRLPVRTYLHTLLDHLEIVMAETIEFAILEDDWLEHLSEERRRDVEALYKEKQCHALDTRRIDCTTFTDKKVVLLKGLSENLPLKSNRARNTALKAVGRLRGRLAHGMPQIATELDELRNTLRHAAPLVNQSSLEDLHRSVKAINEWIEVLSDGLGLSGG